MYVSHPVPSYSLKGNQCGLCSDSFTVVMTAADTYPSCLQGQVVPCSSVWVVIDGNYHWTHHDIFCIH